MASWRLRHRSVSCGRQILLYSRWQRAQRLRNPWQRFASETETDSRLLRARSPSNRCRPGFLYLLQVTDH